MQWVDAICWVVILLCATERWDPIHEHQFLPTVSCDATGQTARPRREYSDIAVDIHQVFPGHCLSHRIYTTNRQTLVSLFWCRKSRQNVSKYTTLDITDCWVLLVFCLFLKALPYVALLIVMLFFIYAVIGMQVSESRDHSIVSVIEFDTLGLFWCRLICACHERNEEWWIPRRV